MMINKAHTTGNMLHDPKAARHEDSRKDPGTTLVRDRSDSWASETDADDFVLRQEYQNAIDCLKQCETIISSLQDELSSKEAHIATLEGRPLERIISTIQDQLSTKNDDLASKDEQIAELLELIHEEEFKDKQIASLEERLVAMSLELASAKAIEDEHRLLKRRISNASMTMSDDNFSAQSGTNVVDIGSLCSSNSHHSSDNKVVQKQATTLSSARRVSRRVFGRRATTDETNSWRNLSLPISRQIGKAERRASTGGSASSPLPQHSWHCSGNILAKDMDGGANSNSSSIPLPHNSWHGRKFLTKEDHTTADVDVGYRPKSQRRGSRTTKGHSRCASLASSSPVEQQETHGADFLSIDITAVTTTTVETKGQPATASRLERRRSSRSDHSRRSDLSSSLPVSSSQYIIDDFHVSTGSLDVDFLDKSENSSSTTTSRDSFDDQAIDALLNDTSSKQSSNSIGRFLRNFSSSMLFEDAIADDLQSVERMVDNDYKMSYIDDSPDASVEARRRGNSDGCIIEDTTSAFKTHTISHAQTRPCRPRNPNRRQSMDSVNINGPRSNNQHINGPRSNNQRPSMNNLGRMLRRTFSQNMLCDAEANSGLQSKHTSDGNLVGTSTHRGGQTANQYIENALHNRRNRNRRPNAIRRMGTDGVLISSLKSSSSTIPGVVFPSTHEEVIDKGCKELGDSLKSNH